MKYCLVWNLYPCPPCPIVSRNNYKIIPDKTRYWWPSLANAKTSQLTLICIFRSSCQHNCWNKIYFKIWVFLVFLDILMFFPNVKTCDLKPTYTSTSWHPVFITVGTHSFFCSLRKLSYKRSNKCQCQLVLKITITIINILNHY